ncbi:glycosyltransferase [Weissella viridescens]|uniref:glycosyltransferase n=1 Tax=Weissella viridescens TaxID=1629 RepID=UPI0040566851
MEKVMLIAAKANMIQQFNLRNLLLLKELGFEPHVATNFIDYGSMDENEVNKLKKWLNEHDIQAHQVDFERGIGNYRTNKVALRQLKSIYRDSPESWAFVHSHSPLGGVLGRMAAHSMKIPNIYTAHGFQFFKTSGKLNWILYPIEKFLSRWTQDLITINQEDYALALKHFKAERTHYVEGVGIDVAGAFAVSEDEKKHQRDTLRKEMGFVQDDFVILNVGELSDRKNQKIVLEAMAQLNNPNMHFVIAGVGPNRDMLLKLAKELHLEKQLHLIGYRSDIRALHYMADLFVFPSFREGLGLAGIEALVDGDYLLGSDVRGIQDYILDDELGQTINPKDATVLSEQIDDVYVHNRKPNLKKYKDQLMAFDKKPVDAEMKRIYGQYK